jgi:cytochrome c biogenesis protein CcdA
MRERMRRLRPACLILLFTLVFVACGAPASTITSAPPTNAVTQVAATPAPVLTGLHEPNDLKAIFNQDAGMPRIILLASPT